MNTYLSISCFFFFLGSVNIALNKPATQSSTWTTPGISYPADKAVDGDVDTFTNTAQDQHPSWWKVDLQDVYSIGKIVIYAPVAAGSELAASLIQWCIGGRARQGDALVVPITLKNFFNHFSAL